MRQLVRTIILAIVAALAFSCDVSGVVSDDAGDTSSTPGTAIQDISTAMASVLSVATGSQKLGDVSAFGGVASDYCNVNGGAASGGTDLTSSDTNFASATGFCQATHNSQSPDTPRGAMYIAGAISCTAGNLGLFTTPGSSTADITIDTTCFGNSDEVAAMVSDMGSSTISGATITVAALASDHAFDYQLTIAGVGSSTMTVYIKDSDNMKAALMDDSGGPWAVALDETQGIVYYEGINTNNHRRMRIRIEGTYASGSFSAVSGLSGFWMQGSASDFGTLVTFSGNLTDGIIGNTYLKSSSDSEGNCHLPTDSSVSCSGQTAISSSDTQGDALHSGLSSNASSLVSNSDGPISFTTVDPSDVDIEQ